VVGLLILGAFISVFPTSCGLLPLLPAMADEARLRDPAWARRREGRGGGVCGVTAEGDGTVDGGVAAGPTTGV